MEIKRAGYFVRHIIVVNNEERQKDTFIPEEVMLTSERIKYFVEAMEKDFKEVGIAL